MTASHQNSTSASTEPLDKPRVSALTLLLKEKPPIASISQLNKKISSPKGNESEPRSIKMLPNTVGKTFNPLATLSEDKEMGDDLSQSYVVVNQSDTSRSSPESNWNLGTTAATSFFSDADKREVSQKHSAVIFPNILDITPTRSSPINIDRSANKPLANMPLKDPVMIVPVGSMSRSIYMPSPKNEKVVGACNKTKSTPTGRISQ